jgi:arylsulfatase A-like enzyme
MAIHAAMVTRMDREIGHVAAQLRAIDQLDNTVILFLSDNRAIAEQIISRDGDGTRLGKPCEHAIPAAHIVCARRRHCVSAGRALAAGSSVRPASGCREW